MDPLAPLDGRTFVKFHAYTHPRVTPNTRARDLVDLVLILAHEAPTTELVKAAVDATFQRRGTHSVSDIVPEPPSGWAKPFTALAAERRLEETLTAAHERVEAYWRSVRAGRQVTGRPAPPIDHLRISHAPDN